VVLKKKNCMEVGFEVTKIISARTFSGSKAGSCSRDQDILKERYKPKAERESIIF